MSRCPGCNPLPPTTKRLTPESLLKALSSRELLEVLTQASRVISDRDTCESAGLRENSSRGLKSRAQLLAMGLIVERHESTCICHDTFASAYEMFEQNSPVLSALKHHPACKAFVSGSLISGLPTSPRRFKEFCQFVLKVLPDRPTFHEEALNAYLDRATTSRVDTVEIRRMMVDEGVLQRGAGSRIYRRVDRL